MGPTSLRYQLARAGFAVRRRLCAERIDRIYGDLIATLDQDAFVERFRPYWNPFSTAEARKFLDLNVWLRESVVRAHLLGIDREPRGLRVLDLGSGTGYFLLIARHFGHDVIGMDLSDEALYNECFDFFGLPRVIHRIEPMTALPKLPGPFDLVTAFMTSFNQYEDKRPWQGEEWRFFIDDLRSRMSVGGRVVIKFNVNPRTSLFYSPEVRRAIKSSPGFRARFLLDYLFLVSR